MFNKFYEMMFLALLMTGTTIAISSSSWFTAWLGLELNLLMMIPLIINKNASLSTESVIKYFLVQAMSSTLFIVFSLLNFLFMKSNSMINSEILITMTLMMKAGIPPLHFWFPQIIEYMEWAQCFIMMTWQKIAPFLMLSFVFNKMLIYFILMSVIVGTLGGYNQNSMKKILTYSSIIHSGWMMAIMMINVKIWFNYFTIYSIILISIVSMIKIFNVISISSLMMLKSKIFYKIIFSMNIFSLAGLPPFLGFLGKFMIISYLLEYNLNLFILNMLILSSLIGLFFYSKMIYSMMTFKSKKMNFIMHQKKSNNEMFFIMFSVFSNLIMPTFILLT
uniref:NADH dehydrogenase subunit 2 n=1 Tax=Tomocerus caputiviolaceus TaxID=2763923 RepID=UPI0021D530B2|nr:NADH dehydrogenase subunit 2 [Tomocerus caputiviolaceus]UXC95405.1 NADH dehydrogenase subunit 2 [Tomocerus caputiviolaceus]